MAVPVWCYRCPSLLRILSPFRIKRTYTTNFGHLCEKTVIQQQMLLRHVVYRPSLFAFPPVDCCKHLNSFRNFSTDRDSNTQKKKVVVVGIPNPFIWFRTRIYYFLIRAYFDHEFNIEDFTAGAKQAFAHVSKLLSQCHFEALEGLVSSETLERVKKKCPLLSDNHKKALAADLDEIMYMTPGDVGIYYDENGRKFVSILMRYWYLTCADIQEESIEGTKVYQMAFGEETSNEAKHLLTANYEFQREFTQGVKPDWTITRIEHSKLLD
ncbi:m-AAA protease-interacting protein 1, mitochondrial [Protopterus annectens]|uniref:m-AAA protease-interacting protein 1, mitochondrial n=1 Tax=Protopterus annectens TaxID=7888 RepID=UPI001CFABC8A|nr:m-AAA protease-interacting protein 1, mitochondrial [Protopterus annectens]